MTYQQAMSFALTQINERIEEIGSVARQAKEDGDDEKNTAARNFQGGFIECADLIDKMMMLVEMSGRKPSRTCAEAKKEIGRLDSENANVDKLERENREMKRRIAALQYWRDISECDCSSPLPQGGCLRCDIDKLLLLGVERRSEPEVDHPPPPVANPCENA